MKTIVESLQDLYVALGGKESDVSGLKLNPDVIEQIAALVNGGALNELPAVTIEDAGDVLTVNASGEWEAAAPGGGGYGTNVLISGTQYNYTSTISPSDLMASFFPDTPEIPPVYHIYYQIDANSDIYYYGDLRRCVNSVNDIEALACVIDACNTGANPNMNIIGFGITYGSNGYEWVSVTLNVAGSQPG